MATTRSIRYTENSQVVNFVPLDSVTSTSTASGQDPYTQGGPIYNAGQLEGYYYNSDIDGSGNWSSGPPPVYQTPTTNTTYYPTTEKLKFDYDIENTPILVAHSSGIPATQCWGKIYIGGMSVRITPVNASPSNLNYSTTATFNYSYRTTAQTHRTLTDVTNEVRTGGLTVYPSANGDLFKVGSDAYTAKTGTTTNDFALNPGTDDMSGKTMSIESQTVVTYATQGGPFTVTLQQQNFHIIYTTTLVRNWEGRNYIFDGSDADHTIPTFQTTSTFDVLAGIARQGQADLESQAAITESSALRRFGSSAISNSFTADIDGNVKLGIDKNLQTRTDLVASTANLRFGFADADTITTLSGTATFKPSVGEKELLSEFITDYTGNMIYDISGEYSWDRINQTLLDNDYQWDDRANWDEWDEGEWGEPLDSWDNWFGNAWARPYTISSQFSTIELPTFKPSGTSVMSSEFSFAEESAFEKAAEAHLTSAITTSFTAQGIIDVTLAIDSAFAPALTANIIYDTGDTPVAITGAFTPVMTASAITDTFADIATEFTFAVTPTHRRGPYQLNLQSEVTDFDIAPTFKPAGFSDMLAFAAELATARLFFSADPYNIYTVEKETRIAVVAKENRQTIIDQEKRVNIINDETRSYLVPQETRNLTIVRPPFKNRYSIPRTRAEA